jgi:hypothetical protein
MMAGPSFLSMDTGRQAERLIREAVSDLAGGPDDK